MVDFQRKRFQKASDEFKAQADSIFSLLKNHSEEHFNMLKMFITREISHVVILNYDPKIMEASDFYSSSMCDNKIKLLSLLGSSNGDLSFRINRYSDGSGFGGDEVIFTASIDEAKEVLKTHINAKEKISSYDFKEAKKHNVDIKPDLLSEYISRTISEREESVSRREKEVRSSRYELEKEKVEFSSILDSLKK